MGCIYMKKGEKGKMIKGNHTLKCISSANSTCQRFMPMRIMERLMDLWEENNY